MPFVRRNGRVVYEADGGLAEAFKPRVDEGQPPEQQQAVQQDVIAFNGAQLFQANPPVYRIEVPPIQAQPAQPRKEEKPREPNIKPLAEPLDLDRLLVEMPRNRVARLGVELEGGWDKAPSGVKIDRDGSVMATEGRDLGGLARAGYPKHKIGEVAIGPMRPIKLAQAMRRYYPPLIDTTCGMHVHMSFLTLYHYVLLADSPAYQETMVAYLTKWAKEERLPENHAIWHRLEGKNDYCQRQFWPEAQISRAGKDHDRKRHGHRYTMVHYNWSRLGTVECRLLPMMENVELAIRAIRKVISVTNAYLIVTDKSKARIDEKLSMVSESQLRYEDSDRIRVVLDDGAVYEEQIKVML